jgi:hypothetical protein
MVPNGDIRKKSPLLTFPKWLFVPLHTERRVLRSLLSRVCLYFHDCPNFVYMPGTKIVGIHSNIHRQGQRIARQFAV